MTGSLLFCICLAYFVVAYFRFRRRGAGDEHCKKKRQVFHKPCRFCFAMTIFIPQRAKGTHRAEGTSLLPTGKNIASSLLQGIPSGRLPRRFAPRNDIKYFVPHKNEKFF